MKFFSIFLGIRPVDELADELLEEGETFFVSVFLLYEPLLLLFLLDFNRS